MYVRTQIMASDYRVFEASGKHSLTFVKFITTASRTINNTHATK